MNRNLSEFSLEHRTKDCKFSIWLDNLDDGRLDLDDLDDPAEETRLEFDLFDYPIGENLKDLLSSAVAMSEGPIRYLGEDSWHEEKRRTFLREFFDRSIRVAQDLSTTCQNIVSNPDVSKDPLDIDCCFYGTIDQLSDHFIHLDVSHATIDVDFGKISVRVSCREMVTERLKDYAFKNATVTPATRMFRHSINLDANPELSKALKDDVLRIVMKYLDSTAKRIYDIDEMFTDTILGDSVSESSSPPVLSEKC